MESHVVGDETHDIVFSPSKFDDGLIEIDHGGHERLILGREETTELRNWLNRMLEED